MIAARKGSNHVLKNLLVTLYSEAQMVGKNKRNGDPTDEEVISVVKKFITNAEETSKILILNSKSNHDQLEEINALNNYLPSQLSEDQLRTIISSYVSSIQNPNIGLVMKYLKDHYSGQYDGKVASMLVKNMV